jgi:2-methylcitrate synthase/citrate synthase II
MPTVGTVVDRGLEGVIVGTTELSSVEGEEGRLTYRGYDIHDLAPSATFEEIVYLLLFGQLPNRHQLSDLKARIGANRALETDVLQWMQLVPKSAWPMDVLRTAVSALALYAPFEPGAGWHESNQRTAITLIAKTPVIVAAWDRVRRGLAPVEPRADLSVAANFLYMMNGEAPSATAERALDTYLVLLADHSFNASTFSARVTASTRADTYAAATAALATLEGDLHGGAPGKVMRMLQEIDHPENAEPYVRALLARGEKIMGMGHREYRVRDPRAQHLEAMAKALGDASNPKWYELARTLENAANDVLQEAKPDRRIFANVEFYTAPTLFSLGIPADEFTCMFSCGRMAGWTAHIIEQLSDNRLIRPQATYVGPQAMKFVPLAERANGRG